MKLRSKLNHRGTILQNISANNYVFDNVYNISLSNKITKLIF